MVKTYVLTLNGSAQCLNTALGASLQGPGENQDQFVRTILLQPFGTNAAAIYVGGDSSVTSSNYGFRLEAAAAGVPPAPFKLEFGDRCIRPSHLYVIGTNTEKLTITLMGF